jgi:hypothetical protein
VALNNKHQAEGKIVVKLAARMSAIYEQAGVGLLAMQDNESEGLNPSEAAMVRWRKLQSHLEGRLSSLRTWRNSWYMTNWSLLAEYLLPRRSIWLTQGGNGNGANSNSMGRGKTINNAIKDSTATYAVRVCSAGLMGGLSSPSRPWFKLVAPSGIELDSDAKAWIDAVEDVMYTVLAGSNFYNAFAQECEDLVVFGTAPTIIYEDKMDIIRCYVPTNGEYYCGSDGTGRIDTFYRLFSMTVNQIVSFFGLENCPEQVIKLWSAKGTGLDTEFSVGHCIEPNYDMDEVDSLEGGFLYHEVYWLYATGSKYPLSERGFKESPFTVSRWSIQSNDSYGRSPGMDILPDVIQLQVMTMRLSEAIEKQVRPPLLADIGLKNQPTSSLPGHVTYAADIGNGKGMRPIYNVAPDIRGMQELILQVQKRIERGLFNDLFLMLEGSGQQTMTAYEVSQKIMEKIQVLGSVIENLLTESLKPKLYRIYQIIKRKGLLPELPDSLQGVDIDLQFVSMLALAQKSTNTGGFERIAALIGNMVGIYPEIKNKLNAEEFISQFNVLLNNPESILRSEKELADMLKAEQAKQAEAEQMMQMQQGAQTAMAASKSAQTLSKTDVGAGQSALQAMLGGLG